MQYKTDAMCKIKNSLGVMHNIMRTMIPDQDDVISRYHNNLTFYIDKSSCTVSHLGGVNNGIVVSSAMQHPVIASVVSCVDRDLPGDVVDRVNAVVRNWNIVLVTPGKSNSRIASGRASERHRASLRDCFVWT